MGHSCQQQWDPTVPKEFTLRPPLLPPRRSPPPIPYSTSLLPYPTLSLPYPSLVTPSPHHPPQDNLTSSYHIQTYSPHRRSPFTSTSSPSASSPSPSSHKSIPIPMTPTEELLFEDTFRNTLSSLKRMLLEYSSNSHFLTSPNERKEVRSQELIQEEIRRTILKMKSLQQNNYSESYKIAAYSLIASQLLDEVEQALAQQVRVNSFPSLSHPCSVLVPSCRVLSRPVLVFILFTECDCCIGEAKRWTWATHPTIQIPSKSFQLSKSNFWSKNWKSWAREPILKRSVVFVGKEERNTCLRVRSKV